MLPQLEQVSQGLADEVLAARLVPLASSFGPFERLVRDLARDQGNAVAITLETGAGRAFGFGKEASPTLVRL